MFFPPRGDPCGVAPTTGVGIGVTANDPDHQPIGSKNEISGLIYMLQEWLDYVSYLDSFFGD